MSIVRPKLFLDTNIPINVANGKIDGAEWLRVQKHIGTNYHYLISFITLKELFSKVARGSGAYFEKNKEPLRILYGPARRKFLPYPSVFAIRTLLGISSIARADESGLVEEKWAETSLHAVIDAPSKDKLKEGVPARNHKRRMQTFDLDHFDSHENRPQNKHAELLQGIRDGTINVAKPRPWAAWILKQHDMPPYTDQCLKLITGLDAAYRFSAALSGISKDPGYDFKAHASDWGDALQLYYLCDDRMHFLTMDADFRNRVTDSSQGSRILLYRDFVRTIPTARP